MLVSFEGSANLSVELYLEDERFIEARIKGLSMDFCLKLLLLVG